MIEINASKCISRYACNKRIMNGKIIFFGGLTIALLFGSYYMIANQKVFAVGGHGNGFAHFYHPDFRYHYSPGYPINPCGGGPYSVVNRQIVCTPA
jgi:hypothetical protein